MKPFYQSPQERCHIPIKLFINLGVGSTLEHRTDIPNSIFETYILVSRPGSTFTINNLHEGPDTTITFPRDADAILFSFHTLVSFFERHESIIWRLYTQEATPPLHEAIKPCYVELKDLPRIKSARYTNATSNLDANEIRECNLKQWARVNLIEPNVFQVAFPSGRLTTFARRNPHNNRISYRREDATTTSQALRIPFWYVLRIQTGNPLPRIGKSLWLLHWANAHTLDHTHLFASPSLRPQHTSIGYTRDLGAQFNNTLTLAPTDTTFAVEITKRDLGIT